MENTLNTVKTGTKATNTYKLVSGNVTRFATEASYEDATRELLSETESPVSVRVGRYPLFVELYVVTA